MRTQTSYPLVVEWFAKAAANAQEQGRGSSALLWRDGLEHLEAMREQRDELLAEKDVLVSALFDALELIVHGGSSEAKARIASTLEQYLDADDKATS